MATDHKILHMVAAAARSVPAVSHSFSIGRRLPPMENGDRSEASISPQLQDLTHTHTHRIWTDSDSGTVEVKTRRS